ncbi:MAG: ABC transporter ATP-binding protein [Oscillospiraceae bacterium]|nr:ABC transporter ATP-binding protein [Oscillospiraceae bacterium]
MAGQERTVKLRLENICKTFKNRDGESLVLDNINLDIYDNEFLCVVGPSGCGKSTLLNILAGLTDASSGTAYCNGVPIDGTGTERGVVFQQYALFPWLTVKKNVMFALEMRGIKGKEAEELAMEYLEGVHLSDYANHYPKELSGGMKQRVAIARAYAAEPEVLLMDEPFGALDAQTRMVLQSDLLETWTKDRKTCFFITHDVEEAVFLSQRIVVMSTHPGRISDIIDVNLPYPRTQDLKMSPEFNEIRKNVWTQVYSDIL